MTIVDYIAIGVLMALVLWAVAGFPRGMLWSWLVRRDIEGVYRQQR